MLNFAPFDWDELFDIFKTTQFLILVKENEWQCSVFFIFMIAGFFEIKSEDKENSFKKH